MPDGFFDKEALSEPSFCDSHSASRRVQRRCPSRANPTAISDLQTGRLDIRMPAGRPRTSATKARDRAKSVRTNFSPVNLSRGPKLSLGTTALRPRVLKSQASFLVYLNMPRTSTSAF